MFVFVVVASADGVVVTWVVAIRVIISTRRGFDSLSAQQLTLAVVFSRPSSTTTCWCSNCFFDTTCNYYERRAKQFVEDIVSLSVAGPEAKKGMQSSNLLGSTLARSDS